MDEGVGVREGWGFLQGLGLGLSRLKNLSQEQAVGNEGTRLVNILCLTSSLPEYVT